MKQGFTLLTSLLLLFSCSSKSQEKQAAPAQEEKQTVEELKPYAELKKETLEKRANKVASLLDDNQHLIWVDTNEESEYLKRLISSIQYYPRNAKAMSDVAIYGIEHGTFIALPESK